MSSLDSLFEGYPERLTPDDVATILGVSRQTVYRYLKAGQIPSYRVGGGWLIVRDELKNHVAAGRTTPPSAPENE